MFQWKFVIPLLALSGSFLVGWAQHALSNERGAEHLQERGFRLNQTELEEKFERFSTRLPFLAEDFHGKDLLRNPELPSTYFHLVTSTPKTPLKTSIDWNKPKTVFEYVFFRVPEHAVVYPTETYYYYAFDAGEKSVAGNFRFVDAEDGILHIGYFNRKDPHSSLGGSASFGQEDGVTVKMIAPFLVQVRYQGITKYFSLNPTAQTLPPSLQLLADEVFISRIFDESGFEFVLLFNERTNAFYYVTNNELTFPDKKIPGPRGYLLGEQSSFVFYEDEPRARLLLVGVHEKNVFMNSYYDGPFDQVPPRLQIRERVYRAYPYSKWRGGIDEHGNFLATKDTRMAISPYTPYRSLAALYEYQARCFIGEQAKRASTLLSCLAYEWKMDFHKWGRNDHQAGQESSHVAQHKGIQAPIFVRQAWPANHYGDASSSWPRDHDAAHSRGLPPNFTFSRVDDQPSVSELICEASSENKARADRCPTA